MHKVGNKIECYNAVLFPFLCTRHITAMYSGMWLYVVCASVHTMYLSMWCLVMYCRLYPVEVARVRIVGWDRLPAVQ